MPLMTKYFHIINSFPVSPLSVAKETIAVEMCICHLGSWLGAPQVSTVIVGLTHLNVSVEMDVRQDSVHMQVLYMRPLVRLSEMWTPRNLKLETLSTAMPLM